MLKIKNNLLRLIGANVSYTIIIYENAHSEWKVKRKEVGNNFFL